MKRILLFAFVLMNIVGYSQYCGNSSSSICNVAGTLNEPGFSPNSENLPPLVNGNTSTIVLQFKNYDTIRAFGSLLTVESMKIDSIGNLPDGTCWSTNKSNNTFDNQEEGCIKIANIPCEATGQYKLDIRVLVDVGFGPIPYNLEQLGIKYYLRLINPGQATPNVDTSQNIAFVGYGQSSICSGTALTVSLSTNQVVCPGAQINISPTVSGGSQPYSYLWSSTGSNLSCNSCTSPSITITSNSTVNVTVTDALNATATGSVTYSIAPTGEISIDGVTLVCQNDTEILTVQPLYDTYDWSTGSNEYYTLINSAGTYSVTVSLDGCLYTGSKIVANAPVPPSVSIIGQSTVVPFNEYTYSVSNDPNYGYYWVAEGGAIISNVNNNSVTVQWGENGPYYLIIERYNTNSGCTTLDTLTITKSNSTGISEGLMLSTTIYPNPSNGLVYLEIANNVNAHISVTDITGKLVNAGTTFIGNGKFTLNLSNAGIYFINTTANGQTATQRLAITK